MSIPKSCIFRIASGKSLFKSQTAPKNKTLHALLQEYKQTEKFQQFLTVIYSFNVDSGNVWILGMIFPHPINLTEVINKKVIDSFLG